MGKEVQQDMERPREHREAELPLKSVRDKDKDRSNYEAVREVVEREYPLRNLIERWLARCKGEGAGYYPVQKIETERQEVRDSAKEKR